MGFREQSALGDTEAQWVGGTSGGTMAEFVRQADRQTAGPLT
jgi:hypothetical protein